MCILDNVEERIKTLEVKSISKGKEKIYKQSANVFLHCMKKLDYLKDILRKKAIIPRYNIEDISFLNIDQEKSIAFPMICFCDIFFGRLQSHMSNYGKYGIGLDKDFGIQSGFEPINYINMDSKLSQNLRKTMEYLYNNYDVPTDDLYVEQLMSNLLYVKPIYGKMKIGNDVYKNMLFADEREWRYIPDMSGTNLPSLLPADELTMDNLRLYSDGLKCNEKQWLKLDINAIKYIILKEESNVHEMIKFIKKLDNWDEEEKDTLISKIVIFNELARDI